MSSMVENVFGIQLSIHVFMLATFQGRGLTCEVVVVVVVVVVGVVGVVGVVLK